MVVSRKELNVPWLLIIRILAKGQEQYSKLGNKYYSEKLNRVGLKTSKRLNNSSDLASLVSKGLLKNIDGRLTLNQKLYDLETISELQPIKLHGRAFKVTVTTFNNNVIVIDNEGKEVANMDSNEFERRYLIIDKK